MDTPNRQGKQKFPIFPSFPRQFLGRWDDTTGCKLAFRSVIYHYEDQRAAKTRHRNPTSPLLELLVLVSWTFFPSTSNVMFVS
jgi:hypothetical protein